MVLEFPNRYFALRKNLQDNEMSSDKKVASYLQSTHPMADSCTIKFDLRYVGEVLSHLVGTIFSFLKGLLFYRLFWHYNMQKLQLNMTMKTFAAVVVG